MPPLSDLQHLEYLDREHSAWLDVGKEFRALGLDMNEGGNAVRLHDAIARWGEELVQLRMNDPNIEHAINALRERREQYGRHCHVAEGGGA